MNCKHDHLNIMTTEMIVNLNLIFEDIVLRYDVTWIK
jgi:hypothetical protein